MKSLICLFIIAYSAAGLRLDSIDFLEAKSGGEYTLNLEEYFENEPDMIWVLLSNIYGEEDEIASIFDNTYNCELSGAIQEELDNLVEFCSESAPVYSALSQILDHLIAILDKCSSVTAHDTAVDFKSIWTQSYSGIMEFSEMLETKAKDSPKLIKNVEMIEIKDIYVGADVIIVHKEDCDQEPGGEEETLSIPNMDQIEEDFQSIFDSHCV